MNAFISAAYRDLACAAAALLISYIVGMSFVQSTATAAVPGAQAPAITVNAGCA